MKPNIFYLVIDSLRADKFYGSNRTSITPNIDNLIKNGAYFEQTISSADATILSWASMFTGMHPFKTGIFTSRFNKLNQNVITFFESLKKYGYNFYSYLPISASKVGIFPTFENNDEAHMFQPDMCSEMGRKIIEKLKSNQMKTPWFFYAHPYNLHFPIAVPKKFNEQKFGNSNYERTLSAIDIWLGKIFENIDTSNTLFVLSADHGAYIPAVSTDNTQINFETNAHIQSIIAKLAGYTPKFLEPAKRSIFFSLGNRRKNSKLNKIKTLELKPHQQRALLDERTNTDKFLFDERVRVPLLFVGYGIKKTQIISQQVRTIDILPTIADICDIKHESDIDGVSLKPLIESKEMNEPIAYMESTPMIQVKSNDVIGVRTSRYKYFRSKDDPTKRVHLFDLKNDPNEDNNIASTHQHVVQEMESSLQNILQNKSADVNITNKTDSDRIDAILKKLGYV